MTDSAFFGKAPQFLLNILGWPGVRWLLRRPTFPVMLQVLGLLCVCGLIVNGWGLGVGRPTEEVMILRKTNLTTLFVWGLWWPGMIAVAILCGRAWCPVCPMELANRVADSLAQRMGLARMGMGPWIRAGWCIVLAYVVLQFLVAGAEIHRVPHFTSLMLISLGALAFAAGMLFREPRSFCNSFCPTKALLSVYGRFTPLQLDVRDPDICEGCTTRECVDPARRARFDGRSCPSLVRPFARAASDDCVLCFQCAKACLYDNVGFGLVRSTASSRRPVLLKPYETAFVLLAAGFVAHEVIGEVKPLDAYFHAVPQRLNALLPHVAFGWFEAVWFLVLFPLALWGGVMGGAYLMGCRGRITRLLQGAAMGAAPVVAIAHLAKAAAKVGSWGGYLPGSLGDPRGIETLAAYMSGVGTPPASLLGLPMLGWVMLFLLLALTWRSWCGIRETAGDLLPAARAGATTTAAFFVLALLAWPLWR